SCHLCFSIGGNICRSPENRGHLIFRLPVHVTDCQFAPFSLGAFHPSPMKEFASIFFKHLSGYVVTLRSVTSTPTRAIADRVINKRNRLNNAFVFVAMMLAI